MSGGLLPYGTCLTRREYEAAVVNLHGKAETAGSEIERESIERQELDLTIDYRLGKDFPNDRRQQLWQVQKKIQKRRLKNLTARAMGLVSPKWLYSQSNWMARMIASEYANVLNARELAAYFGEE